MKVLVTGATGFVGSAIVHELRARKLDVRALVREPARASRLHSWGVELARGDVTDAASTAAAAEGCTHAVHLVAILTGSPSDFERIMVDGTRNVLAAAREAGVQRLVHMSALGVYEETKDLVPYYASKWQMEQDVAASGVEHVIFRPSFVFGKGGALKTFVRQVRYSPVVTVIGPGTQRIQPVWIDDVAAHFAVALDRPGVTGRTFELGGPDVVDWNELYRRIAKVLGKRRTLVHVPFPVARTGAKVTSWLPRAPLSPDQVTMLATGDNVVQQNDAAEAFDLPRVTLDDQLRRAV